ncbi:MAG: LTA synthase family protein [Flavobacteriales bacterium]|nr:LTA synthase family protein [Flavobacteriales bacterium]
MPVLRYLIRTYALFVVVYMAFRIVLLGLGVTGRPSTPDTLQALVIGWRFDTTVACYLLALPFLLLLGTWLLRITGTWPIRAVHLFLVVLQVPVLLILAADIPWSLHYLTRLSASALLWADSPGYMAGMVLQDPSFRAALLLYVIVLVIVVFALRWFLRRCLFELERPGHGTPARRGAVLLITGGLLFLGMRGRVDEKQPIHAGLAYFSADPFLNQLGLNPVFTFATSLAKHMAESRPAVALMDDTEALRTTQHLLNVPAGAPSNSPLARPVTPDRALRPMNVVVVLMESMSTFKMGDYNGPQGLTPILNDLQQRSLSFAHCYSAGIHTFNGIYSTLYSFPALYRQQPLQEWLDKRHRGLARELHDHGYGAVFYSTHDPQFDNVSGFLRSHGFDAVISEDDYPGEWVLSTNGVPDHRMFEFALPRLDAMASEAPFLAVFMTTSDHKPYIIPDDIWYTPQDRPLDERIVEYCDRSIGRFLEKASHHPWYNNTLFVFLGDHGLNMGHTYDMPLSFHHIPLIVHAPGGQVAQARITSPCGQIDVAPTLLGLLNVPWTNTTMGVDVLREPRTAIAFCADDRIGCLDSTHYYIERPDGRSTLYRYATLSTEDLIHAEPEHAARLRLQAYSQMQTTQWLLDKDMLCGKEDLPLR